MRELNCNCFREMILSAANNLENNYQEIDKLNVFPVPDGDTGTNMKMTFVSGVNDTINYINDYIGDTAKYLSKRMLMGARGNSGVILSQIFKGFANALVGVQNVDINQLAAGFSNGAKIAYKAVMRPVEGTILTVAREVAEAANDYVSKENDGDIVKFFDYLIEAGDVSLSKTPDLLPVLKEVGVVDSGGSGYMCILKGMQSYLHGNPIVLNTAKEETKEKKSGYCVEISVDLNEFYQKEFKIEKLNKSLGRTCNEIKLKRNNDTVLLHVHTTNPGEIVTTCQRFGEMTTVKIQNLNSKVDEILDFSEEEVAEKKAYGLITVCTGDGVKELFNSYGVDYIINGGQTMNPSSGDFVDIINKINADNIIILPNNSNIILAANQAKDIVENKNIYVLPTKSIPQGLAACINFDCEGKLENNLLNMQQAIEAIASGSVTTAIKDTTVNGIEIRENDYMGIKEKDIVVSGNNLIDIAEKLVDNMINEESCYLTIIYGEMVDENTANELLTYVNQKYDIEGEVVSGKQPLYQFILGLE